MTHRVIVHWNQWLSHELGRYVLAKEEGCLQNLCTGLYGKHSVLIGVSEQTSMLKVLDLPCPLLLSPLYPKAHEDFKAVESGLHELPLASGSVDLVVLPHTLELVDNPRQLLAEACRIVKPEGHLIISGFNPLSLWGLKRALFRRHGHFPSLHFQSLRHLKNWLALSDFELVTQTHTLYSPPFNNGKFLNKLRFIEWLGNKCHLPGGGAYVLMAKAKVIPLTPIRMRWKQKLAAVSIPSSIPGPTIRNSNT